MSANGGGASHCCFLPLISGFIFSILVMYTPFKILIPIWKANAIGNPLRGVTDAVWVLRNIQGWGAILEIVILGVTHIYYCMQGV